MIVIVQTIRKTTYRTRDPIEIKEQTKTRSVIIFHGNILYFLSNVCSSVGYRISIADEMYYVKN